MKAKNTPQMFPFMMLWASQSISSLGTAMTSYALAIWVYGQHGDASSMTLLTLCSFIPTILIRFLAGAVADRWDKKAILLLADFTAACGTFVILILYTGSALQVVHLYIINILLSLMNAFQVPAAYAATSLLVPKEQYMKAGGLQSASSAIVSILSPVLGALVLARGSLTAVLLIDLLTFAAAFGTLLFILIPRTTEQQHIREPFWQSCLGGVKYLWKHPFLLRLILYIAAVNLLAKLGPDGLMSIFVLTRSSSDQQILGFVQSAMALGLLAGSLLATTAKTSRSSTIMIFTMCALIFLSGIGLSLSSSGISWCITAFLQYLFAAVMNVQWSTLMRTSVPADLQGRVFSARDTLQNCTIPLGLYLGGILTDEFFEPLAISSPPLLTAVFGSGSGAGVALQFLLVSITGLILTLVCLACRDAFQPDTDKIL